MGKTGWLVIGVLLPIRLSAVLIGVGAGALVVAAGRK
jgi:hypothetical protein